MMKISFLALLSLSAMMFSQGAHAADLVCNPPGFDGTPRITGQIVGDSTLDSATETYVFEQGSMEPSNLGKLVAEPMKPGYETRVFVLENNAKVGTEFLLLPSNLGELPAGSTFKATYLESDPVTGTLTHERRSLDCKITH